MSGISTYHSSCHSWWNKKTQRNKHLERHRVTTHIHRERERDRQRREEGQGQRHEQTEIESLLPPHSAVELLGFLLVDFWRFRKDPRRKNVDPQHVCCVRWCLNKHGQTHEHWQTQTRLHFASLNLKLSTNAEHTDGYHILVFLTVAYSTAVFRPR